MVRHRAIRPPGAAEQPSCKPVTLTDCHCFTASCKDNRQLQQKECTLGTICQVGIVNSKLSILSNKQYYEQNSKRPRAKPMHNSAKV